MAMVAAQLGDSVGESREAIQTVKRERLQPAQIDDRIEEEKRRDEVKRFEKFWRYEGGEPLVSWLPEQA